MSSKSGWAAIALSLCVVGFGVQSLTPDLAKKRTETISNLKQAGLAVLMYATDCDDVTPPTKTVAQLERVVRPYVKKASLFKTFNPASGKLLLNQSTVAVWITSIDRPSETPMIYESKPWPDGKRVVAYWDGHVVAADRTAWKRAQPYLKLKLVKVGPPKNKAVLKR